MSVVVPAFAQDESPTAPGHEWRCNGCTFRTDHKERAIDHAIESKTESPFPHLLYERPYGDDKTRPRRRIVVYQDGKVLCEVAPTPKKREGRKRG